MNYNVQSKCRKIYVGMDISLLSIEIYVLLNANEGKSFGKIGNTEEEINNFFDGFTDPNDTIVAVLETGTHSTSIARLLKNRGCEVIVANARNLAFIYKSDKKNDKVDAEKLARMAHYDPKLLSPVNIIDEDRQKALIAIKSRDELMKTRTSIINNIRGQLRHLGISDKGYTSEIINQIYEILPEQDKPLFRGLFVSLTAITEQIKYYDKLIEKISETYSETQIMQQIKGVGPLTSLHFALIIGDPKRFSSQQCASYVGLVPKQDQSGEVDKQLGITKSGNKMQRRYLVQCAQYMLGPFGEDCDIRDWGLRLMQRGGGIAKKKAIIAVARKIAITMLALWKNPDIKYDPHYKNNRKKTKSA